MITAQTLRDAMLSGSNNLGNQRQRVDSLNVFPVPDGDTGTNMSMTMGAAAQELEAMDPSSATVYDVAHTAASALLRGARGNSGVITSLLFRGFSKGLKGKETADAGDFVEALSKGVAAAYKAVMKPPRAPCSPWPGSPPRPPRRNMSRGWRSGSCGTWW